MIRELNTEQKQRIDLTLHTQEIINSDHEPFGLPLRFHQKRLFE